MKNGGDEYRFSLKEIKQLALLMRRNEASIPNDLRSFFSYLESRIYDFMSVEEAERFFNEE